MEIKLTLEEAYEYELKCNDAIAVCDYAFKMFILQDFSDKTMSLKVRH